MEKFNGVCLILLYIYIGKGLCANGLHLTVEPRDIVVEPGGAARLDCVATSTYGLINIQWRTEDGQTINFIGDSYRSQLANGSLYISSVYPENPELTGSYQCLVTVDGVGSIVSRTAFIKLASLPGFEREPQDTAVYPGQIAYLSCTLLPSISQINIQWLKDEHPLTLDESRMTILPSGALEIDDVRPQDVGSYRCNASAFSQARLSNKAQLALLTTDFDQSITSPVFIAKPREQIAIEGTTITLECAANGSPRPTILWLKDGIAVDLAALDSRYRKVAASSLMITDIMEEDDGSYQCRAENEMETLDAVAVVTVQVPPRFIKRPQDKVAAENQDLEFECEIYGKPEPKVIWLKNGEKITLSEYWQLVNNNNLRINGLLAIDAGIFQCIGVNPAGNVQASARLTINQPKKVTQLSAKFYQKKKLSHRQRQLYNNTWQHPSTLLGHTLSAFTPNPSLSISPSDDPADLLGRLNNNPRNTLNDPQSPFLDDTDSMENNDGSLSSPPRNLSVAIVKTRFVTLRWQEPENANGELLTYFVYYKQEGSQRERVVNTSSQKQLEIVVRGLQPGVTYQFRVVAHNARGAGASSEIITVTTHSEADVPGPPLSLTGHATSSSSIKVSWQQPKILNGRISKYVVTVTEGTDGEERTRETTSTTYELIDLTPYTEYNIWVHAVNENGPGASTSEITIRTYSAQPSAPPHNVTLEAASSTSIIVRWEPPLEGRNGIITGYKIRYRRQDRRFHSNTITTEGNQRLYVVTGLEKHGIYHVRICALNVNGTGPWTEWMAVETYENDLDESAVPSSPTNLRTKPMADAISIWWSSPKDDRIKVRGYKIGWGKGYPDVVTHDVDGKQRFYTIESLEPVSEYVISLRAMNEAGEGPPIYANVRTTEKSTPESIAPLIPPVGLKAIVLSANTVVLYWTDTSLSKSQYVTDNRYYVVRYAAYHPLQLSPRYKYFNATDLNCMIDDLRPNSQYEFTVKTVKGKRESPWSMIVLNQTQEAAPTTPPRDLTVTSGDERPGLVVVRWQPPKQSNGQIIGYIISYSTDNTKRDRDWLVDGVLGNKTEYIVRGLKPNTNYFFKIQARNAKGYGPFSSVVSFKTASDSMDYYDDVYGRDGRGFSGVLLYVIVGCAVILITGIAIVVAFFCCRKGKKSPDRKKGYLKEINQKTNIKPPDLWIHHDQMELKAMEKTSMNGEASTSGIVSNTLPRSGNIDYSHDSTPVNSGSLDKRTYVPSYMGNMDDKCSTLSRQHSRGKSKLITLPIDGGPVLQPIASATTIVNGSLSQPTIHNSCQDTTSSSSSSSTATRTIYPRTVAQYSLNRAHITLEPTPESTPDSCKIPVNYEQLQTPIGYLPNGPTYPPSTPYSSGPFVNGNQNSTTTTNINNVNGNVRDCGNGNNNTNGSNSTDSGSIKRLQGHPLKSFSVPAPPPQSTPTTPAQTKIGVTVRPSLTGSPYKKQSLSSSSSGLTKNRLNSASSTIHTPEEIERLKPSYSTEELNQEMANLEGLMKDLNAITASEFEC